MLFGKDLDKVFSYQTGKVLRIVDRKIGFLYYTICLIILSYIIFYVFLHLEGYANFEKSTGYVVASLTGKAFAYDISEREVIFDEGDFVKPFEETSAIFMASKISIIDDQAMGYCGNKQCKKNADCKDVALLATGTCLPEGYCEEYTWCPPPRPDTFTNYTLENLDNLTLKFTAMINFKVDSSNPVAYTSPQNGAETLYPSANASAIKVADILNSAGISYRQIRDTGAIIQMLFKWNCRVDKDDPCYPQIQISRLDESTSDQSLFNVQSSYVYYVNGQQRRGYSLNTGIRILFISEGFGKSISISQIILQVSSALALLNLASIISDFVMLYLYPKELREEYWGVKVTDTEDFSDLQEKLDYIRKRDIEKTSRKRNEEGEEDNEENE